LKPCARTLADRVARQVARAAVSLALLVVGAALVIGCLVLSSNALLFAVASALALAVGILLGAPFFVPPLIKLLGLLVGRFGASSKLAMSNAVRNPGRAAATCTALMLAVGLIVTLQVIAATVKTSMDG